MTALAIQVEKSSRFPDVWIPVNELPEEYVVEPRDLAGRIDYYEWHIARYQHAPVGKDAVFDTAEDKRRCIRMLQKRLEQLNVQKANEHVCECCGILLTATQGSLGPECSGHPEKFPCKNHGHRAATGGA